MHTQQDRRRCHFLPIVLLALAACPWLTGCPASPADEDGGVGGDGTGGPATIVFTDEDGAVVARGTIEIGPDASIDDAFTGEWKITETPGKFPREMGTEGRFQAAPADGGMVINLDPNMVDNNISFNLKRDGDGWAGAWSYSTIAGVTEQGRVSIQ